MLCKKNLLLIILAIFAPDLLAEQIEQPMRVLQNRYFVKSLRPSIGAFAGSFINEAYTATETAGLRASLFFNEWLGIEYQQMRTKVENSTDRKNLEELNYRAVQSNKIVHPDPEINAVHASKDVSILFVPFYGKIDVLDLAIIYLDFYALTGFSVVETDQGDLSALAVGIGQKFYLQKNFALRFDFRQRSYYEILDDKKQRKDAQSFDFGLNYYFL